MLTQKQENFTLNLFKGMTQRDAWINAGYSSKYSLTLVDIHACQLANKGKIKVRLAELRQEVTDAAIATVEERQQRLTEFVREDVISPKTGGLVRTGNIMSIDLLNKMDKIYSDTTINIDNRKIEITVSGEQAKSLTQRLIDGENT